MLKMLDDLECLLAHTDGVTWERLEVESGLGVRIEAPEEMAAGPGAPSKILVMQAPGGASLGSLQDLLSLPPYPVAPASGAPFPVYIPMKASMVIS